MKYNQFIAELTAAGCYVSRHGANHDIWYSPITGELFPIPRHGGKEVPKGLERKARKTVLLGKWSRYNAGSVIHKKKGI